MLKLLFILMGSVLGSDDRWCVPLPEINCSVLLTGRHVVSYRSDTCSHLPRHSSNSIHLWSQFGLAAADADRTYWFSTASFQCLIWYFKKEKKINWCILTGKRVRNQQTKKWNVLFPLSKWDSVIIQLRGASIKQCSSFFLFLGSLSRMIVCRHQTSGVHENISLWDFRPSSANNASILPHIVV